MKILIITHNFPPDLGAASFRMESLIRFLSEKHQVTVLTAYPNRYKSIKVEMKDNFNENVKVVRIPSLKQSNNLFQRGISFLDFFLKSYIIARKLVKGHDVVVATSPQIFSGFLGALIVNDEKPFVLDIRDLWPDAMVDLGLTRINSFVYKMLKKIEIYMYKKADKIVINSPAFEEYIRNMGNKDVYLVTNGVDMEFFEYFKKIDIISPPRKPFRILYAGNLGLAQDIKILTELNDRIFNDFYFVLIGDGSQRNEIEREINRKGIKNIELRLPIERQKLLKEYEAADALFVHLRNIPMFSKTIPSKIFEYVATRKPVIYGVTGVTKQILDEMKAGIAFEPGNVTDLERALEELKYILNEGLWKYEVNPILEKRYLRPILAKRFAEVIEDAYCEHIQNNLK